MNIETTDPAEELGEALRRIVEIPEIKDSREQTYSIIRKHLFGDKISTPDYLDIVAALSRRVSNMQVFVTELADPELDNQQRSQVSQALKKFSYVLDPKTQATPWINVKAKGPTSEHATILGWFKTFVRRHKKLRKLTDDERRQLIEKIDSVLGSFPEHEIPGWARAPLKDGLVRLRLRA